jgi:hypothetical protein
MISLRTLLVFFLIFSSGCSIYTDTSSTIDGCYINPNKDLSAIGRVAIVELGNDSGYPQISTDMTETLFQALQKKQLFSLNIIRQNDPAWHSLQLDLDSMYTLEQLFAIRKTLKRDAVLVGTVTKYTPYPHMAVGLRVRLLDLRDGELLWGIERIWDSSDKITEHQIKNYYKQQIRSGFAPLREQLAIMSQRKFLEFVTYQTAETLEPEDRVRRPVTIVLKRP